jgi:hypothetical protein
MKCTFLHPKDIRSSIVKVFSGLASNGGDYILFRQVLKTRPNQKDVILLQSKAKLFRRDIFITFREAVKQM